MEPIEPTDPKVPADYQGIQYNKVTYTVDGKSLTLLVCQQCGLYVGDTAKHEKYCPANQFGYRVR